MPTSGDGYMVTALIDHRPGREKCNGAKPICQTCVSSVRSCTYATNPKKRGIQPGYIRALELSLAWLFAQDDGAEKALRQQLAKPGSEVQHLVSGKSSASGDTWHNRWSSSIICKQIDRLLSGADGEDLSLCELDEHEKSNYNHDTSEVQSQAGGLPTFGHTANYTLPSLSSLDPNTTISSPIAGRVNGNTSASEVGSPASNLMLARIDSNKNVRLKLPTNFWKLLDIYYIHTHLSLIHI